MQTQPDCLLCFVNQALATTRRFGADVECQERALRAVLGLLQAADTRLSPPQIAAQIYPALYDALDDPDPYAAIKRESNQRALELYPDLVESVQRSADPLVTAVRLALAGNIIDFGTTAEFDLEATIERMLAEKLALDDIDLLKKRVTSAERILYLADNAGEIVLDRLLIEQLIDGRKIALAVRSGPIINDVTREDMDGLGLENLVQVVDPGPVLPGIWLERSSEDFKRLFEQADLIISKGQGNFETLHELGDRYPVLFLFLVKCQVVARHLGLRLGDPVAAFSR
jgi:uncharacterized protein with ATP-grasp and redox domains